MNHFTASLAHSPCLPLSLSLWARLWQPCVAQINYAHLEHSHSGFVDVRKSAVDGAACRGPDLWTTVLIVRLGHYAAGLLSANRFEPEMALLFPPG